MAVLDLLGSMLKYVRKVFCSIDSDDEMTINWSANNPGFTDEFSKKMYRNLKENLNIDGSGAIVASPDTATPGGSYYYHWMRDAGLTMMSWIDINNDDYEILKVVLNAYVDWVFKVQKKFDPNHIDVRIEPKFEIPSGDPYTGAWGRPQTDGPALRAIALSKWGLILINYGKNEEARCKIWPLVKFDLEWVLQNWNSTGFDLWEEVQSNDFYFNRMSYIYSLNIASEFAEKLKDEEVMAKTYKKMAKSIKISTKSHWNGKFIYQSQNRPKDGAVIHAIVTFGIHLFGPDTKEAISTIRTLCETFYNEYSINQTMNEKGVPGILIGRYPGDHYAGGNPWQLLTAALAEYFYLLAIDILKHKVNDTARIRRYLAMLNIHPPNNGNNYQIIFSSNDLNSLLLIPVDILSLFTLVI